MDAASAHGWFWHESEVPSWLAYVCYRGQTGKQLLTSRLTGFDPKRTSKLSQFVIAKFAGAMPDFTVGVTTDWSWTSI
jgi:hypothetical protein